MSRRIAERPYQAMIAMESVRAGVLCFVCFTLPAYGRLLQLDLTGGADALSVSIGNGDGTVDEHGFGNDFGGVSFDWRGPQLSPNPSVLASGLTTADFNYRRIVMRFGANTLTYAIDDVDFIEFTRVPVPAPASVWLAAVGLGLFLKKRVPALTKSQG